MLAKISEKHPTPMYYPYLDLAAFKVNLSTSWSYFRWPWDMQRTLSNKNIKQEVKLKISVRWYNHNPSQIGPEESTDSGL